MGWISTPMTRPKYKAERVRSVLKEFLFGWTPDKRPRVIDYAEKRGAIFLKLESKSGLWVAIIQYEFADGELFYRVDDNTTGSARVDCPARILKEVPIYNRYDAEWRTKCAAKASNKEN